MEKRAHQVADRKPWRPAMGHLELSDLRQALRLMKLQGIHRLSAEILADNLYKQAVDTVDGAIRRMMR